MILLSIQGLFRTVLIIIGVIVIMRFVGKLMMAKRSVQEHQKNMKDLKNQEEMISETKKNFGKTYMGIVRSTFIINPQGELIKEWRNLRVKGHAQEVFDFIQAL